MSGFQLTHLQSFKGKKGIQGNEEEEEECLSRFLDSGV